MREPEGSVALLGLLLLSGILAASAAPLASKQDEQLPHSRDYYDGYVRALVDHYDEIFRSQRDLSSDNHENTGERSVAEDVSQRAAKKDDVQNADENASSGTQANSTANNQVDAQNSTVGDRPYVNPEQTGKPPVTDTEKEEAPTPDAHKKNENDQSSSPETLTQLQSQQNMFSSSEASNLPETMKDIKFYSGKPTEFEDVKKKRSTENDVLSPDSNKIQKPNVVEVASMKTGAAPVTTGAASSTTGTASTATVPTTNIASAVPVSVPDATTNSAKRQDMQSESKIISHSSSTYTPGDPSKTPPQQRPTPPDPNKQEPYKKDEKEGRSEAPNDDPKKDDEEDTDENSNAIKDAGKNKEKADVENKKQSDDSENLETDEEKTKSEKEFDGKSDDEEDQEQEFKGLPSQPFIPMLVVPINVENGQDLSNMFASVGDRKDNVGKKREDKKDDKKDDDDDDDEDEHDNHAYLAPLWGYPGWYEAGHGIPYGYGTNMLYGHHEHGHHGHGYGYGFGHHGFGHHSYGHHGHHGHHSHHGHDLILDNGVVWPYGGHGGISFFHSPCGCNSGISNDFGFRLPSIFI